MRIRATFIAALAVLAACGDDIHPVVAELMVSPQTGLHTTETGGNATVTVMLTAQPQDMVTVMVESSNPAEGTALPTELQFTPDDYRTPRSVTITGVDDTVVDGPQPYIVRITPMDPGLNEVDVSVINDDDDAAGALVTPTVGLITSEAGGQAMFTVALTAQPAADVRIPLASSNPGEGTIGISQLVFTRDNWHAPQAVTVTGVDDQIADGPVPYTILLGSMVSVDPTFAGVDPDDVQVTNLDNDTPGFVVTPTTGLVTTESGGTASYTIALASQPAADVTVPITSSRPTEALPSPTSVTFTSANWNAPQTVTVIGQDDLLADGDQAYVIIQQPAVSNDPRYAGLDPDDVMGTNLDNDSPGVLVTPTAGLTTSEGGGQATFTIVLLSQPAADVTFALASSDPTEGSVSPASVTFTAANWNAPHTVTVTGVDDFIADGNQPYAVITSPATSADPNYAGLDPDDVQVTNLDNDSPGVIVTPTAGLITTESGGTATFTVVLQSQPIAIVAIPIATSDATEGTPSTAQLVFTPANWAAPQTVTVTGVDDAIADGNQPYTIVVGTTASADPSYSGLDPADVSCTNLDNDSAAILVTPSSGLVTTESGGTDHFTVVLLERPTADVTIALAPSDITEGSVFPTSLVFTTATWNQPQTVTITGINDTIPDGNQLYTIVTAPAVSADPAYNGLDPADVTVTNLDDDLPGFTVTPTSGLITSEFGDTDTFTIVLNTQPIASVFIPLSSSDTTEGTVAASVIFTSTNWNVPQTVTVRGVDDAIADGNILYTIITGAATSADPKYAGLNPADVAVANIDNETPQVYVKARPRLTTSENGNSVTFKVRLTVAPSAPVVCTLHSSNTAEDVVSATSLTFTPASFGFQTVTITGVPDGVHDGDQVVTIVLDACASSDPAYNGANPPDLTVINRDIN